MNYALLICTDGVSTPEIAATAPKGRARIGANPHANGTAVTVPLVIPNFGDYAVKVSRPGAEWAESTRPLGAMLRDVAGGKLVVIEKRSAGAPRTRWR